MILLDTDHASVLGYPESDRCKRLTQRLESVGDEVVSVTCVTVALLLTANKRDYSLIPSLKFENWIDG